MSEQNKEILCKIMSEQTKKIFCKFMSLCSHLLFAAITYLAVKGGWISYQEYLSYNTTISIDGLSTESKEKLASELIKDGFSIPKAVK